MQEIILTENLVEVRINQTPFTIDCDDMDNQLAVQSFLDTYKGNRIVSTTFLQDCRHVIDILLGKDAYVQLFEKEDLKPYYVILRLAEVMQNNFEEHAVTDQMRERQSQAKQEAENMQKIVSSFNEFSKQMQYAENKYGMNHVSDKRRSAKKHPR